MTKEKLTARIAVLQQEFDKTKNIYEQSRAQVDALAGAIQDCQFWLSELERPADAPMSEDQKDA